MKIVDTFVIVEDSLYSVKYDSEEAHEFERLFNLWNDPEYLESFFQKHKADLNNSFWNGITVEKAIKQTREDAKKLEKKLREIAEKGKTNNDETLSTFFQPLSKGKYGEFEKDKAKQSWLRIYAIRIDVNEFVVSGGAIKLTKTMNERPHLLDELKKLDITLKSLQDGEDEEDDLDFLELY